MVDHSQHEHHHHHQVAPGFTRSEADYAIPPVTLTNQNGRPVALRELLAADSPVMLNFIFTSCTAICPAMSAIFANVQRELGDAMGNLRMVSVSIDPEQDTPMALNAYAQRFEAGPQWTFLTGSLEDIIAVQQAFDADRGDKTNHAPLTLMRTAPGSRWVRYDGFVPAHDLVDAYTDAVQHGARQQPAVIRGTGPASADYAAGYAFGTRLAELKKQSAGVELEAVFRGILDAMSGGKAASPAQDAADISVQPAAAGAGSATSPVVTATAPATQAARPSQVRQRGYRDDFAALNAQREGVVTLPSGVQYEVLAAGSGPRPTAADAVVLNYRGSLSSGAVFDTTYEDSEPARLQLSEVAVPGLKEALLLMNAGAKWRVVIPPNMGFKRSGNNMLRRRDLIYDIEMLAVEPAAKPTAASFAGAEAGGAPQPSATPADNAAPPAAQP